MKLVVLVLVVFLLSGKAPTIPLVPKASIDPTNIPKIKKILNIKHIFNFIKQKKK